MTMPKLLPPPLRTAKRSNKDGILVVAHELLKEVDFLTSVLVFVGVYHSAIRKDDFEIDDVVGSPAVLGAEEAQSACSRVQ